VIESIDVLLNVTSVGMFHIKTF